MNAKDERKEIRSILAKDRYADCPNGFNRRRFSAIRHSMEERYMRELMATPDGLYTSRQIWEQTFGSYIKN